MSLDLRPRRGSRAESRAWSDFKPKKLAGCFGGLSPGPGLPIGSAIGQISSAQIASTNQLLGTFNPTATWVLNGAAAIAAVAADQWDAGFIPALFTSNNGAADFVSQIIPTSLPATQYAVSGQFVAGSSTAARMAVNWTGGVARQDSIDFNPATGTLLAVSAGVTAPSIVIFSTVIAGVKKNALAVSFVAPATPAGTNNATFRIFPNVNAGAGTVEAGGFQVEVGAVASAFISTNAIATASRPLGAIPRMVIDRAESFIVNPALPAAYTAIEDSGRTFAVNATGVFNVPQGSINGEWFNLYIQGATVTVTGTGGAVFNVPGVSGGVASFVVPFDGAATSAGLFNVNGIRLVWDANGGTPRWNVYSIAETHGTRLFTANGTFTTGGGMTALWVDAAAGGGGGGGCAAVNSAAGGGGGGQSVKDNFLAPAPNTAISITIGGAGTGGAAGNNNGTAGTNTIIGALLTLTGGALGTGSASGATAAGGAAGGANAQAGDAGQLIAGTLAKGGEGGNALYGPAESTVLVSGAGSAAGNPGVGFGCGGGGGASSTTGAAAAGGSGTAGFVSVRW